MTFIQIKKYFFYGVFVTAVISYIVLFFPGLMSLDSTTMYQLASSGTYCDNTSYLMVWVWNKLNRIYPGPALMFLVNMGLLWGSVYILAFHVLSSTWARYFAIFCPYSIWISIYAGWIWKDTLLAFGYCFLCVWLIWKEQEKRQFSLWQSLTFWAILIYSTEVKWCQTRFIFPLIVLWFVQVQWSNLHKIKKLTVTVALSAFLAISVGYMHKKAFSNVPSTTHFWQYRYIYDLAGMSVYSKHCLVPGFLVLKPGLDPIKEKYCDLWEPLIVEQDSPLRKTCSDAERVELFQSWKSAVLTHPLSYVQHRGRMFFENMLGWNTALGPRWIPVVERFPMLYFLPLLRNCIETYVWFLPLQILLAVFPCTTRVRRLNRIGLAWMAVLSVFSLAGTARYLILSFTLCIFSTALWLNDWRQKSVRSTV